ncbi:MAG TPA: phosphoribosyltransferase family protein [Fimbriimonadaceae bacterium]|nr:phosphoribosyltransferase family protein [Fimbriimonadaceae bacterium]
MNGAPLFRDREAGGMALAEALSRYADTECVVYGLPRGGAVTAKAVADFLGKPLDLLIVRKLSHPYQREYAIGAITDQGEVVLNKRAVSDVSQEYIEEEKARKLAEANERRIAYLGFREPVPVEGKTAIIVDDGIATGSTMRAGAIALQKRGPKRIVVAAPVGPPNVEARFEGAVDEVVVPYKPGDFFAIGSYYRDFAPVEDEEVQEIVKEAYHERAEAP